MRASVIRKRGCSLRAGSFASRRISAASRCSGRAQVPVGFGPTRLEGRLLPATDGLVKYAPADKLADAACIPDLTRAADALVACVRLPSGRFQDDVAFVLTG